MKVKRGNVEITIDPIDLPKYVRAGWKRKVEVHPAKRRERYDNQLEKERNK